MNNSDDSRLSRRSLLQAAMLGSIALGSQWQASAAAATALPLITKPIPSTGERLPVIGLGTIWFRDANYATLKPVFQRFFELGGTVIDTASTYGESEGVVGRALADLGRRNKTFLATKFDAGHMRAMTDAERIAARTGPGPGGVDGPPPGIERPDADGVGGRAAYERSLQRLRTAKLDLQQVHNMGDVEALVPLMMELKKAGKLRYVGVSAAAAQPARVVEVLKAYPIDFVQLDFSLSNRAADKGALQACQEHKAAVLINLPLGRNTMLRKVQGRPLPAWAADIDVTSWAQYFLKYVVSHPAVTCALPGTTSVAHLEDDMRAARGRLPDAAQRQRMEKDWDALA
jgi:aryl-alcohol dehydrogenase-like predicted oxidoreductase